MTIDITYRGVSVVSEADVRSIIDRALDAEHKIEIAELKLRIAELTKQIPTFTYISNPHPSTITYATCVQSSGAFNS